MKRLLQLLSIMLFSLNSPAQKPPVDLITPISGPPIEADIIEVSKDQVKFTYVGASAVNSLDKSAIKKIQLKSGRIETFSDKDDMRKPALAHGNKVAILPFTYPREEQSYHNEKSLKVQHECYAYLDKHAGNYRILDIHATNAALAKAGISGSNINNFSMKEICNMLGVAYVVTGIVTVDEDMQISNQLNMDNTSPKRNGKRTKSRSSRHSSSNTTADQNCESLMNLSIYNDKGISVFTHNRKAFWHQRNACKAGLEYLLKSSPLYKK